MREIAKKYPKMWDKFANWIYLTYRDHANFNFNQMYGYLVLEFFPKHRIYIGSRPCKVEGKWETSYNIVCRMYESMMEGGMWSPEEVIEKAFGILEKQLEEK